MVVIRNSFDGGLVADARPERQPKQSYSYALNAVEQTTDSLGVGIARELSNKLVKSVPGTVVGASYIDEESATIFFTKDGGNAIYIYYHDTEELKHVATDTEFCCEWDFSGCEWIYAETNKLDPCRETIIYFASKCVYYRINLTELLDPVRREGIREATCANAEIDCDKFVNDPKCQRCKDLTCDYFKLFKGACGPKINAVFSEQGGYSLPAGSYQFSVQLEDNAGNKTNWLWLSDQVNVTSENNIPGEVSEGKISVMLTNLDCKYDKVNIAVVANVTGVTFANVIQSRHYNSKTVSFEYYGQKGRDISLEEILTKRKQFIHGKDLIAKDGRLWLYNIKPERNLDYQRRAFEIDVSWVAYETTATSAAQYHYRSLMRDEAYLFGIVWQYIDNTESPVFILKPRGACGAAATEQMNLDESSPATGTIRMNEGKCIRCRGNGSGGCGVSSGCAGGVCSDGTDNGDSFAPGEGFSPDNPNDPDNDGTDLADKALGNWDTMSDAFIRAARCNECAEDEIAAEDDLPDYELMTAEWMNTISEAGLDKDNPDLTKATTFKDSAKKMVEDAVTKAEFTVYESPEVTSSNPSAVGPKGVGDAPTSDDGDLPIGGANDVVKPAEPKRTTTKQNHGEISGEGENIAEELPRAVQWGQFGTKCSDIVYPDAKNCEGEYIFGSEANEQIKLFQAPDVRQVPIVKSDVLGVVSKFTPDNNEFEKTYVRHLGIRVDGVQIPDEDELPKPLCPHQPYRIVMVPRDRLNSTVIAKGISTSCFLGSARGTTYCYPRNGVNSICTVDRMVDVGGSHLADDAGNDFTHYNFHSLDTRTEHIGLGVHSVKCESAIYGSGWMHGLYAEGFEPEDKMYGRRIDQKGYRAAVNLNQMDGGAFGESQLSGITYARANSVVNNPSGIDHPLMNMYRESSVYYKVDSALPPLIQNSWGGTDGSRTDSSFFTDTADHFGPINGASALYTALRREIPDQYGSVEGMRFIDTGLVAHRKSNSVQGLCGDVFVGPDTFVRKSYVSNKVGNEFPTPERDRTVCDNPDDEIMELLGINHYPTRLPETGDESDAKNWAGGYEFDRHETVHEAKANAREDFYYPRVQKTLITYWGEFKYNPWTRQTAKGSQKDLGYVYYPKLKDMYLDSDAPMEHPWEESFLNKFYYAIEQPSRSQLLRKALIRNVIAILLPALGISTLTDLESYIDTTGFFVGLPILIALWWLANKVLTRDDHLNRLLGIPVCKTDSEGGQYDDNIKDFNDNYDKNSKDFSWDGGVEGFYAPTFPYNTCICDDCLDDETTNEVFFSEKHKPGMIIDAYKNFNSLDFAEIPNAEGQLRKLFVVGNNLYAHTTEAIFLLKYGPLQTQTNLSSSLLGGNEMLVDPQQMMEAVPEGFAGLQDPNSAISTVAGYFWIDRKAKRLYRFTGQIEEVSRKGNFNWFKNNLGFCDIGDCFDEKVAGSSYFALGWDNRLNRLLVTKHDMGGNSWTMSYSMADQGKWVSAHSYVPRFYIWDRDRLYSMKDNDLYIHHVEGSYGEFYGEKYPFEVEFSAWHDSLMDFEFSSAEMYSTAEAFNEGWVRNLDVTFDRMALWNSTQGTGWLSTDIEGNDYGDGENMFDRITEKAGFVKLNKEGSRWNISALHDFRKRDCLHKPMLLKPSCQPFTDINQSIFDCSATNTDDGRGQRLSDNHMVYRLSYNKDSDKNLILTSFDTVINDLDNPTK